MTDSSDVIVIGAGPVGSQAALKLAQSGLNAIVYEEHSEIGVPAHCAGHINIQGLTRLGVTPLPTEVVENVYRGAIFHSPAGNSFEFRSDLPITCSINRSLFDKHMARKARNAGAQFILDSKVEELGIMKDSLTVVSVKQQKGTKRTQCKIVIDAEGISSRILRQTDLPKLNSRMLVNGIEAEAENVGDVASDMVEVFLGASYAPGFYAWLMPKKDGYAKIGLGAKGANPIDLLRKLVAKHPIMSKKLRKSRIVRSVVHPITLGGPIPKAYSRGFLAVGDVASQVKSTTGGGVVFGMTCASAAAEVAKKSIESNDFSPDFLAEYQQRVNDIIGFDSRIMLRMRKTLDRISDARMDSLIALCSRVGFDEALKNVKDIDLQGRALLGVLRSPRALAVLGYFLFAFLFANV